MSSLKWTRRSARRLARQLQRMGHCIGATTVARLLKSLGFKLRVNRKSVACSRHPDRDRQFRRIEERRATFVAKGLPIISIDPKKNELVGLFQNAGAALSRKSREVLDDDFRSRTDALAVPYGIYDLQTNRGTVFVGEPADTPQFAVDCVTAWWRSEGRRRYPAADRLLVLADGGGSNGWRPRAWKYCLQHTLYDPCGLRVTVAHYLTSCLFGPISVNWAGRALESFEVIVNYIRTTVTCTGLRVRAERNTKTYKQGVRISKQQMADLSLHRDETLPRRTLTRTAVPSGKPVGWHHRPSSLGPWPLSPSKGTTARRGQPNKWCRTPTSSAKGQRYPQIGVIYFWVSPKLRQIRLAFSRH